MPNPPPGCRGRAQRGQEDEGNSAEVRRGEVDL